MTLDHRWQTILHQPMALGKRMGVRTKHCFSIDTSCSFDMWLWLRPPDPFAQVLFFFFITLGLEMSDSKVYEP